MTRGKLPVSCTGGSHTAGEPSAEELLEVELATKRAQTKARGCGPVLLRTPFCDETAADLLGRACAGED